MCIRWDCRTAGDVDSEKGSQGGKAYLAKKTSCCEHASEKTASKWYFFACSRFIFR